MALLIIEDYGEKTGSGLVKIAQVARN